MKNSNKKIGLIQFNPYIADIEGNSKNILYYYHLLIEAGADIVTTPELSLIGYPAKDILLSKNIIKLIQKEIILLAEKTTSVPLIVGFPYLMNPILDQSNSKKAQNAICVCYEGKITQIVSKTILPEYDIFEEKRYFNKNQSYKNIIHLNEFSIGCFICEDIWDLKDKNNPVNHIQNNVFNFSLIISCSPFTLDPLGTSKIEQRRKIVQGISRVTHKPTIYINQVGSSEDTLFDGSSFGVSASGELNWQLPSFSQCNAILELSEHKTEISFIQFPQNKLNNSSFNETNFEYLNHTLYSNKNNSLINKKKISKNYLKNINASFICPHLLFNDTDIDLLEKALIYAIYDFCKKSSFSQVLVGLSGGIDSALVATLAVMALGKNQVLGIAMPSEYSSDHSIIDAKDLTKKLGISYDELSIKDIHKSFKNSLFHRVKEDLKTTAQENIQSRIRGALLMFISNQYGQLLLNTGNKSELAMGYCTLYGDMVGGLSPIGDIYKTQVYQLASWINRTKVIIPFSSLKKHPSAELKANQKDTDSLPEYALLDNILYLSIEKNYCPSEITKIIQKDTFIKKTNCQAINLNEFNQTFVEKIVYSIHQSEYKRYQSPPILKISNKSFGSGRKYPLVKKNHHLL